MIRYFYLTRNIFGLIIVISPLAGFLCIDHSLFLSPGFLCGLIVGGGLAYTWQRTWLKIAGTCGLLGAAITLHAIYNLLIAYGGAAQYVAYALPVLLVAAGKLSTFRLSRRK